MKPRVAGFRKDKVSDPFNFLERIVEHTVNVIRIYEYKVDGTVLTTFLKIRKSYVEKWNIAVVVNLNCDEKNHYTHCLMSQR
jgi:hypothetical protein